MTTILFYSDEKYEYQAETLLKSFELNGKMNYNFLYYTIGFTSTIEFPNLVKKEWPVDEKIPRTNQRVDGVDRPIFEFYKPDICLDALEMYDNLLFMDVDMVISRRFDVGNILNDKSYPLAILSVFEYPFKLTNEPDGSITIYNELALMEYYNVPKRSMWYTGVCFILFNRNCLDFIKEWRSMCKNEFLLQKQVVYFPYPEETPFNLCLWKRGVTENLGHAFVNTHKFSTIKLIEESDDIINCQIDPNNIYEFCYDSSKIMFYHGTKHKDENEKIFEYFKQRSV